MLAARSSYFRRFFSEDWVETDERHLSISGVSPEVMELLLTFCHEHRLPSYPPSLFPELLSAAERFGVDRLKVGAELGKGMFHPLCLRMGRRNWSVLEQALAQTERRPSRQQCHLYQV